MNNLKNININLDGNPIQLLYANSKIYDLSSNTLLPVLNLINKKSSIYYNLENNSELLTYLHAYIGTITELLFAFNSFLLKYVYHYCVKHNINYYYCFN